MSVTWSWIITLPSTTWVLQGPLGFNKSHICFKLPHIILFDIKLMETSKLWLPFNLLFLTLLLLFDIRNMYDIFVHTDYSHPFGQHWVKRQMNTCDPARNELLTYRINTRNDMALDYFQWCFVAVLLILPLLYELSSTFRYYAKMSLYYLCVNIAAVFVIILSLWRPGNIENYRWEVSSRSSSTSSSYPSWSLADFRERAPYSNPKMCSTIRGAFFYLCFLLFFPFEVGLRGLLPLWFFFFFFCCTTQSGDMFHSTGR